MAFAIVTGTWIGSGATPQTVSLPGGFGTPIAIIARMVGQAAAPAAGSPAANAVLSMGFGTRRGGATQTGCVGFFSADNVGTTDVGSTYNTTLLHVLSAAGTTDYTVALDSFGADAFTISYSSAANANGDFFEYVAIVADDAIVLNWLMDSTGATEVVTGAGFQGNVLFGLDADAPTAGSINARIAFSFGCATSATAFWSATIMATDNDTMTSTQNWNKALRTDAFLERLGADSDVTNARWNLASFDADGCTLGVVDAPGSTDRVAPLLLIKGGKWEAGSKLKATVTGNDTFTLADASLTPSGVILATLNQVGAGITLGNYNMCIGFGSTPNATRGSAVNNVGGVTGPEADPTTTDRFRATDSVIEELTTGGAETSEAWYDTASAGSFIIDWAVNGGSQSRILYLAAGPAGTTFNNSVSGAITFTGILTPQAQKALAGAVTFNGALALRTARAFAGAVTFVGDLVKQTRRALAGAVTFNGLLTTSKVFANNVAGAATFVGTLLTQAQKVFAGPATFVGTLALQTARAFAGAVAFVGERTAQVGKTLTGAATFQGDRTATIQKTLAGTLDLSAELTTVYQPGAGGGSSIYISTLTGVGR